MVCPPCKVQDHSSCPEITRRVIILQDETLPAALKALHTRSGQICDCQHGTDTY
jgi:hypothetical protein